MGKVRQARSETAITLRADKDCDATEFIAELGRLKVQPHVAQITSRRRSAVPDEAAHSADCGMSMQCRKRVEQMLVLNMSAYKLVRMRSPGQLRPQGAR